MEKRPRFIILYYWLWRWKCEMYALLITRHWWRLWQRSIKSYWGNTRIELAFFICFHRGCVTCLPITRALRPRETHWLTHKQDESLLCYRVTHASHTDPQTRPVTFSLPQSHTHESHWCTNTPRVTFHYNRVTHTSHTDPQTHPESLHYHRVTHTSHTAPQTRPESHTRVTQMHKHAQSHTR